MLVLKENVKIKDLEKYGFYKPKKGQYKKYVLLTNNNSRDGSHLSICKYNNKQKMIMLIQYAYDYKLGLDVLYDLIKADLVEKVGEKI
jgi:hypothetical protein